MKNIKFDIAQQNIFDYLKNYLQQQRNYLSFLRKPILKNGIYLYGAVGRGKTLIMEECFQLVNKPKKLIHYQEFVENLHKDLHKISSESKNTILKIIAKQYAINNNYLFIDEFEIKDITDAMMVVPLLYELIKLKQFIFLTSNTQPVNLYKNGVQRESFLPYIKIINNEFEVVKLDSLTDYRFTNFPQDTNRILYPNNAENNLKIDNIIMHLTDNDLKPQVINVFGRKITFNNTNNNILVTNFEELFLRDLSYIDYINICKNFIVIIIKDVKVINPNNSDVIIRLINFIDNAYFAKVIIYMTLETIPAEIYSGNARMAEFERTKSRIYEMNSSLYK